MSKSYSKYTLDFGDKTFKEGHKLQKDVLIKLKMKMLGWVLIPHDKGPYKKKRHQGYTCTEGQPHEEGTCLKRQEDLFMWMPRQGERPLRKLPLSAN